MASQPQRKNRLAPAADAAALKQLLGLGRDSLTPTYYRDAIFLAIDFKGHQHESLPGVKQVGVSTLDTRDLPRASELGHSLIHAKLYCVPKRNSKPRGLRRYKEEMSKRFQLSEPEWITRDQIPSTLTTIFRLLGRSSESSTTSTQPDEEPRNIVLIGHNLGSVLATMEKLSFRPDLHARIVAHVDTWNLAGAIRAPTQSTKLRALVRDELSGKNLYEAGARPSRRGLRIAGNNAVCVLEAMLLLILKEYRETVKAPTWWWIKLTRLSIPELVHSASANSELGERIAGLRELVELDTSESAIQGLDVGGMEEVPPAFLLAAARWQMIRQWGETCALRAFDAQAQLIVGDAAYNRAACAMPLFFALAPPWHVCCERY